jgi:hypothetical protein
MEWLIDGHNLIGHMPGLRLDDPHDEEKLLEYLCRYRARTSHHLTVVFDAGHTYQPATTRRRNGITVQFAPHGQKADQLIIRRLGNVKNRQAVIVVTSDRAIQQAALNRKVRFMAAAEFSRQLLSSLHQTPIDEESHHHPPIPAHEIEEWLEIFNQSKS